MKKLFNKVIAIAISFAMVVALGTGIYFSKDTKADAIMTLSNWEFMQGGVYNNSKETLNGNVYYFDKITMNGTGEVINGWLEDDGSHAGDVTPQACTKQTQSATQSATGFNMVIKKSGWDRTWSTDPWRINPWAFYASVQSQMNLDHRYRVTFKAKANKSKNCFVDFKTTVDGYEMEPWDPEHGATMEEGSDSQYITIGTVEKSFTYIFYDYVGGETLTSKLLLGSFCNAEDGNMYDYAGNQMTGFTEDAGWTGNVTISDFQVEDLDPDKPTQEHTTEPPLYTTTAPSPTVAPQPTQAPTVKPSPAPAKKLAKVTGVKVKNTKKKTIKVSWKKVANAKAYQIKVGNKTYKATKNSKKIKNKKFKKGKKVKVKVRATATGYTTGAWSKTVKKKLTK